MVDRDKPVHPNTDAMIVGVDVGGTKIAAGLIDWDGHLIRHVRCQTDVHSPSATLDSIAGAINQLIGESGYPLDNIQAVGIGVPGIVDSVKGVGIASVNLNWRDVPVKAEMETRLDLPCFLENDVKTAALGEIRYGAGRGLGNLALLNIGTGISAAIVIDNEIYRGVHGMAGEIGHIVVRPDGPLCKCGGRGCFEALASAPSIAARLNKKVQDSRGTSSISIPQTEDENFRAEGVFRAALQGDRLALETVSEVSEDIAFVVQLLALSYDPQMIVLAGGVSMAGNTLLDPVMRSLQRLAAQNWVFGMLFHPDFVKITQLGIEVGMLGAAAMASSQINGKPSESI
jgi:glucokinase